jgi:periplasmic protein CpxP/Spy
MMSEETRRVIGLDDGDLAKWRSGGRTQKARTLLLVAGVSIAILFAFKMLSAAPLPQYGGQQMHRQRGPEQQLARLSQRLNLTDEQQAKIKPLLEDQHKQMMALREDSSLSREERRAKFQEIRKQTMEKMNPILTSEQQKQLQQMQQMRHERHGREGWNQPPSGN